MISFNDRFILNYYTEVYMSNYKDVFLPGDRFIDYRELTELVEMISGRYKDLCRLESIGSSREGRIIHMLVLTDFKSGVPEDKPAYLIYGNIHACELAGSHAAIYTAARLVEEKPELLKEMVFYIIPRLNPDGAEFAVKTGGSIRSRTDTSIRTPNSLFQEDLDGNGLILSMRQVHPDGGLVADPFDPRLMIKRRFDSKGPFYRVFQEGKIHEWDGSDDITIGGRSFDWNRNWPYDWRPEPEQGGAGDYPFSEKEMRSMGEFISGRNNIFGILGYHTGPGAVLRPPSSGSDRDIDESDILLMEELASIGSKETGYPVIPVFKYHWNNRRDINLKGHFHNFGYNHLGLPVFEFELGTMHHSAGITTEERFSATSDKMEEEFKRRIMKWWDNDGRKFPLFVDWKEFMHPQLGKIEIGGFILSYFSNPALGDLEKIFKGTYNFTIEYARRRPRILIEDLSVEKRGDVYRIRAKVANRGAFSSSITRKGRTLARMKSVRVDFSTSDRTRLLSLKSCYNIGHMDANSSRTLEWFVESSGGPLGEIIVHAGTGGNFRLNVEA